MKAAASGHTDMVTALLPAGADVNAQTKVSSSVAIARYIYLLCVSTMTDVCVCVIVSL